MKHLIAYSLFESESNDTSVLDDILSDKDLPISAAKKALEDELGNVKKVELEDVDESLALTIAGVALSTGKLAELAGLGIKFSGKMLKLKGLENVGDWLHEKGHAYTHKIESLVKKILQLIPAYKEADDKTQDKIAKYVLIGVITALMGYSGFEAYHGIEKGKTAVAAIEGALTTLKGSEIVSLVGQVAGKTIQELAPAA